MVRTFPGVPGSWLYQDMLVGHAHLWVDSEVACSSVHVVYHQVLEVVLIVGRRHFLLLILFCLVSPPAVLSVVVVHKIHHSFPLFLPDWDHDLVGQLEFAA
jgi:hypothetical protein